MATTRRVSMVLGALVAVMACAPDAGPTVTGEGVAPIPDSPITEREQYEGSIDPSAAEDHVVMPAANVDGDISGLAPPLDDSTVISSGGDNSVRVDALAACRPATGYSAGRQSDICVTEVDGHLVEIRTAEAFERMRAAAASAGVHMSIVSGFRTMDQQRYLYNCYLTGSCNNGNLAARPGYSNHQSGLALDLNTSASGVLSWLNNHGSEYGFRRTVPTEVWHWERPAGSQAGVSGGASDGKCWSTTMNRSMDERACVQSRSDSRWYQCNAGLWRAGEGSQGACQGRYPLGSTAPAAPAAATTCFSSTTQRNQPFGACVQSRADRLWYQCTHSGWSHSASIPTSGPVGACVVRLPL